MAALNPMLVFTLHIGLRLCLLVIALLAVPLTLTQPRAIHELAFTLDGSLLRLDLDSGILFEVVTPDGARDPVWSPDGERIAFTAADGSYGSDIYVIGADGGGLTNVTVQMNNANGSSRVAYPVWSPSASTGGSQIALLAEWGNAYLQVFTINLDTGAIRHISSDADYNGRPIWSPDGQFIAFDNGRNIRIVGREQRLLPTVVDEWLDNDSFVWSPDSERLAFEAGEQAKSVYVINRDGAQLRELVSGRMPAWSPDGEFIAFTQDVYMPVYHYRFAIVNVETGAVEQFPQMYASAFSPSWSPSGDMVAFGCDQADEIDFAAFVCLLDVKSEQVTRTDYHLDRFSPLVWRPDTGR